MNEPGKQKLERQSSCSQVEDEKPFSDQTPDLTEETFDSSGLPTERILISASMIIYCWGRSEKLAIANSIKCRL